MLADLIYQNDDKYYIKSIKFFEKLPSYSVIHLFLKLNLNY